MVSAGAKESQTQLGVSAIVRAVARLELHSVPAHLIVGPRDIARGYIEVGEPTAVSIRSNSQSGYALEFTTLSVPLIEATSTVLPWSDTFAAEFSEPETLTKRASTLKGLALRT